MSVKSDGDGIRRRKKKWKGKEEGKKVMETKRNAHKRMRGFISSQQLAIKVAQLYTLTHLADMYQ